MYTNMEFKDTLTLSLSVRHVIMPSYDFHSCKVLHNACVLQQKLHLKFPIPRILTSELLLFVCVSVCITVTFNLLRHPDQLL